MNEFLARVRWGNVGRIFAVVAAIALVVAWPRLKAKPPSLPPAATVPRTQPDPLTQTAAEAPPTTTETIPATTPVLADSAPKKKTKTRHRKRKHARRKLSTPAPRPRPLAPVPSVRSRPKPEFQPFG